MICDKCGSNNPSGQTQCSACGAEMPAIKGCGGFADIMNFAPNNVPVASATIQTEGYSEKDMNFLKKKTSDIAQTSEKNLQLSLIAIGVSVLVLLVTIISFCITNSKLNKLQQAGEPAEENISEGQMEEKTEASSSATTEQKEAPAPKTVTLTFEFDGDVPMAAKAPDTETYQAGETVALQKPDKVPGYKFVGWTKNGEPVEKEFKITEDTIVVGTWKELGNKSVGKNEQLTFDSLTIVTGISGTAPVQAKNEAQESGKLLVQYGGGEDSFALKNDKTTALSAGDVFTLDKDTTVELAGDYEATTKDEETIAVPKHTKITLLKDTEVEFVDNAGLTGLKVADSEPITVKAADAFDAAIVGD